MNVEIWAEAALFPEKEYINGIFLVVWDGVMLHMTGYENLNSNAHMPGSIQEG
jgi:hypothetical protein